MPPPPIRKMTSTFRNIYARSAAFLTPRSSTPDPAAACTASVNTLFPQVDPMIDGEDCNKECSTCTISYPKKFSIEQDDEIYGNVKGWATHILVATGKADWVRDVEDEKGSVMEAVGKANISPSNGKLKLSASNMPVPQEYYHAEPGNQPANVLILPAFTLVENVHPNSVPELIHRFVEPSSTTTTPLKTANAISEHELVKSFSALELPPQSPPTPAPETDLVPQSTLPLSTLTSRPSPHKYLILLCSQKTRDARCGQSAPLLRRELERHLRPLGLYRDLDDERPGGVGIYFISHVGGHKYSANMIIYRRGDVSPEQDEAGEQGEATQGIWLARVRPEDIEGIVKYTLLQGKVIKPERYLRGGFDREKGLVSW